jgi:hypothetical protein
MRKVAAAIVMLSYSSITLAHGGGLNSDGCHNDNSNGTYHCHNGSSSESSSSSGGELAALIVGVAVTTWLLYWLLESRDSYVAKPPQDNRWTVHPSISEEGSSVLIEYKF